VEPRLVMGADVLRTQRGRVWRSGRASSLEKHVFGSDSVFFER
jgi:hypothetical protein